MNTPNNHEDHELDLPSEEIAARRNRGSLRSKLVLSLGAMFLVFLVVDELVRQQVIKPSFVRLEHSGAIRDANRVLAAVDVEAEYMMEIGEQLAARIDPFDMTIVGNDTHLGGEQARNSWKTQRVAWVAVVGTDSSWRWLHQGAKLDAIDKDDLAFPTVDQLVRDSKGDPFRGKARVANKLFMFAGAPIAPREAENSYYLVVGRALDAEMIRAISKRTQVDFSIQLSRRPRIAKPLDVWAADRSTLVVETPLLGADSLPLANVFVQVPRNITMRSEITNTVARNTFVFGVIAALLFLLMLLQRIVVGPITAIREHTEKIAEQGLNASKLVLPKNDEIGELADAFDRMTLRLSETQQKLADASHAAGMSQVADTVIHNVGNVLTNVNSLIDTATDRVKSLRIQPLDKLAKRMQQGDAEGELLAAVPPYLEGLATALESDREELRQLLTTLSDNVSHIHDVIRDQRRHTLTHVNKTRFSIKGIIEEAIGCCRARLDKDNIRVKTPDVGDVEVEADRSLLLQIVINIISNARHAISSNDAQSPSLCIEIENDNQQIQILFRDSGCGMSPETLKRVFEAHFTTRDNGSGLGLHFCAIAMERQGGSIKAESDGEGKGSTFILELPRPHPRPVVMPASSSDQIPTLAGSQS